MTKLWILLRLRTNYMFSYAWGQNYGFCYAWGQTTCSPMLEDKIMDSATLADKIMDSATLADKIMDSATLADKIMDSAMLADNKSYRNNYDKTMRFLFLFCQTCKKRLKRRNKGTGTRLDFSLSFQGHFLLKQNYGY